MGARTVDLPRFWSVSSDSLCTPKLDTYEGLIDAILRRNGDLLDWVMTGASVFRVSSVRVVVNQLIEDFVACDEVGCGGWCADVSRFLGAGRAGGYADHLHPGC